MARSRQSSSLGAGGRGVALGVALALVAAAPTPAFARAVDEGVPALAVGLASSGAGALRGAKPPAAAGNDLLDPDACVCTLAVPGLEALQAGEALPSLAVAPRPLLPLAFAPKAGPPPSRRLI